MREVAFRLPTRAQEVLQPLGWMLGYDDAIESPRGDSQYSGFG